MLRRFCSVWLFATLWTMARQAPLSMGFSRQEYWRGLPFPPPGDLPDPGIEPASLPVSCIGRWVFFFFFLPLAPPGKPALERGSKLQSTLLEDGKWKMVSILATYSQFLTLSAVRMKDTSDHVTSLLKPPKGNSSYSRRKSTFLPRPSDLWACLASIPPLPLLPFLSSWVFCSGLAGLFAVSHPNQEPRVCGLRAGFSLCPFLCLLFVAFVIVSLLSYVWLCDPMDCSPPGSSVHGIFQARILEWVAIYSSRGASWLRNRTHVSSLRLSYLGSPNLLEVCA